MSQFSEKELMLELIKTKYGDILEAKQLEAIEKSLDQVIEAVKEIRRIPLENSDEPFNVFKPYRRDLT